MQLYLVANYRIFKALSVQMALIKAIPCILPFRWLGPKTYFTLSFLHFIDFHSLLPQYICAFAKALHFCHSVIAFLPVTFFENLAAFICLQVFFRCLLFARRITTSCSDRL